MISKTKKINRLEKMEEEYASSLSHSVEGFKNVVVKEILKGIAHDSRKHAGFYNAISSLLKGPSPALEEQDYNRLEKIIEKHIIVEKRMMQEVPKATVVITNPTHIAVALKYDEKNMSAPQVIAKGTNFIAEKIKEIAKREGIPIVEDKPLAQALNKVEINDYIPEKLYKVVAKILAHIYKLGAKV